MRHLSHVWLIMLKDLEALSRDRLALFLFILFPLIFVALSNLIMSSVGAGTESLVLHMATREQEEGLSHRIIELIATSDADVDPGEPQLVYHEDYSTALLEVENSELEGFLAFPEGFTRALSERAGAELYVVAHARALGTRAALHSLANYIATRIGAQAAASRAAEELLTEHGRVDPSDPSEIDEAVEQIASGSGWDIGRSYVDLETQSAGSAESMNPANVVIPGHLVMFVFLAAALGGAWIVRERQNNTLERLLASSVSRWAILGGMFASISAKGLIQVAMFWAVGLVAFDMNAGGSLGGVIVLSILTVAMSSSFAIMLAALARSRRSAETVAVLGSLVLAPLGGCWWPLFYTPEWMQLMGRAVPHGWATNGFNKFMVFGAEFGEAVPEMIALAGFAIAFAVVGMWRFRMSVP